MIVEPGLLDHPKFLRLERRLGDQALAVLIRIWGHCQAEQRGEKWRGADAEYVEAVARWKGEAGKVAKDLSDCGFVEIKEGVVVIHDWSEHNRSLVSSWKNGAFGGRPKKKKSIPTGNPPETHGFPTGNPPETHGFPTGNPPETDRKPVGPQRREEKRREEKTSSSLPPPQVSKPSDVVVESSVRGPFSESEISEIEQVWALWPKRIETIPAQVEIGHAIRRHGLVTVLEGTRKIVAAEAETKSTPRGRYLPKPTEFFGASRYLDDPAHYGPRAASVDPSVIRARIAEIEAQLKDHPGNPNNTEGSLERKKEAMPEFRSLCEQLTEIRKQLNGVLVASS